MRKTYRTFAMIKEDGEIQLDFCGSLNTEETQLEAVVMWTTDPDWLNWACDPWFPVEVEFDDEYIRDHAREHWWGY